MKINDSMKILIIDDDKIVRTELKEALLDEGYHVTAVSSAKEALNKCNDNDYQIVFTDLIMPGMDGLNILKRIKENNPETHVVLITGFPSINTAVQSMKNGAFDYISKPFKIDEIRKIIKNIITKPNLLPKQRSKYPWNTRNNQLEQTMRAIGENAMGRPSLIITPNNPQDIYKYFDSERSEYYWLKTKIKNKSNSNNNSNVLYCNRGSSDLIQYFELEFKNIFKIKELIFSFIQRNDQSYIFLPNFEHLANNFSLEILKKFIMELNINLVKHQSKLVITLDSNKVESHLLQMIQQTLSDPYKDTITDAISNDIRREIIQYLFKNKQANFSELFRELDISETPKLSFHLKKLAKYGLITLDDKNYQLNNKGLIGAEFLSMLDEFGCKDENNRIILKLLN